MVKYTILIFFILVVASPEVSYSKNTSEIPEKWLKKGETVTKILGISLYNGVLYTPNADAFDIEGQYALSLSYLRSFKSSTLIKSTIKEIDRIEGLISQDKKTLRKLLSNCFVDVLAGDRITALSLSKDKVRFFYNGSKQCDLEILDIRRKFFSIWLGNDTRDIEGSLRLQGLK